MRPALAALLLLIVPTLAACPPKLIAGTEINDNAETRSIFGLVDTYRQALNDRSVDGVMKLVGKSFFENSGTPEGSDDYDYAGLEKKLKDWVTKTKQVRVSIEVKNISIEGDVAKVQYYFDTNYQILPNTEGTPPMWKHDSDTKEMTLKREGNAWRIISGV